MSIEQLDHLVGLIRSRPPLGDGDVAEMRAALEGMGAMLPVDPEARFSAVEIDSLRAEWADAPEADPARAVLYLHGGGYVAGSVAAYRSLTARLSRAASARVLVPGYRLAPEHPFPAAIEDSVAAYRWLLQQGYGPKSVAVAGDSAGGGLAVATLLSIREAELARPAAGVLLSPLLDLEATGESMTTKAGEDPIVEPANVLLNRTRYLNGADPRSPLASPLYADLAGLPPLLIQVGTSECLLDDSRRFAARAREAAVEVQIEEWERMIHVWQAFAPMLDEGQQAIDRIGAFLRDTFD